jgi:hypothetical protein
MTEIRLDRELVNALVSGRLDEAGEAVLAEQVARVIPHHWTLPNPLAADLSRIEHHFGGEPAVFEWPERHPGRPGW